MQEIKDSITYFKPVVRNGWILKFSVCKSSDILLLVVSKYTGQTIIRYFTEESDAVSYINYILEQNPKEILE